MKHCVGCGDSHIVIFVTVPLCQHCVDNTQGQGEFGDYSDELDLEFLSLELLEPGSELPTWHLNELWGTPQGTFQVA